MSNPTDLNHYRRLLLAKQQELLAPQGGRMVLAAEGGLAGVNVMDQPVARCEAVINARRSQAKSNLWRAVGWALVRLSRGNYGTCASCGNPISRARLKAVPWADYCLDCVVQERARS